MALAPLTLNTSAEDPSAVHVLPPSNTPLNLLLESPLERSRSQWLLIFVGSLLLHIIFFFAAIRLPSFIALEQPEHRVIVRRTPLYLPPDVLTQREPNKQKISKSIDLADLHATPAQRPQRAAPAPSRRQLEMPSAPVSKQLAKTNPQILPEPPKVAVNQPPVSPPSGIALGLPPPVAPQPSEGPFQNIGSEAPPNPHPTLAPPKSKIQAAINDLAQNAPGHQLSMSDDNSSEPAQRIPGSMGQPAAPHAAVELQSDPQGADFKPYLTRILTIVRANWRRVVPESARMGTLHGRTVMEFIINRDGSIPKIVTAASSGSDPLDRAALAGLSMSNPLPPLPADFKGFQVRLAFTFSYNLPSQ